MAKYKDNEEFINSVLGAAKQAEDNALILTGRAQALKDMVKFINDNNVEIVIHKNTEEGK